MPFRLQDVPIKPFPIEKNLKFRNTHLEPSSTIIINSVLNDRRSTDGGSTSVKNINLSGLRLLFFIVETFRRMLAVTPDII